MKNNITKAMNTLDIDVLLNLRNMNVLFDDVFTTLFEDAKPNVEDYTNRYEDLETRMCIVWDYLDRTKEKVEECVELLKNAKSTIIIQGVNTAQN